MPCIIQDLHNGMNLRDEPLNAKPGDTGKTIGCDFSTPGLIKPMRESLLIKTYDEDIQYVQLCYVGSVKYQFTTHASGLYVNQTLIDEDFTGIFKAKVVNDEYAILMNKYYWRKWKPGWDTTYQLGLNTPSAPPTLAAGDVGTTTIEDFESLTAWSFSGGGTGGNMAANTSVYYEGSQSMELTCDADYTIQASDTSASLDMTVIDSEDATDKTYFECAIYTADLSKVSYINLMFSCAVGGSFTKDFYSYRINLGGYVYATLTSSSGEMNPVIGDSNSTYQLTSSGAIREVYDPTKKTIYTYQIVYDTVGVQSNQLDEFNIPLPVTTTSVTYEKLYNSTVIPVNVDSSDYFMTSGAWSILKIPLADFIRHGDTDGRDWATITAIQIELAAIDGQAVVCFDGFDVSGTGSLWGYYRAAYAFQNDLGNYGPYTDFTDEVYCQAQSLEFSNLEVDTDGQTTTRRIAVMGGNITSPMIFTIDDNTSTEYTFAGSESDFQEEELYFNNKPPAVGTDFEVAFGRIFIVGLSEYASRVSYSEAGYYEAFPLLNYKSVSEGEQLRQVSVLGDYIALRGKDREHWMQFLGSNHTTWRIIKGAREGSVNSNFLLDLGKAEVYAGPTRLYLSSSEGLESSYLDGINPTISDFTKILGAVAGEKAYIYYKDKDNTDWIMRIDYSLNKPVAHYVESIRPTAIVSDPINDKVIYAYGKYLYMLDSGPNPLPVTLTTKGQYCDSAAQKTFGPNMSYELWNGDMTMTFKVDRVAISGTYSLPEAIMPAEPVTLPNLEGRELEITLESTDDFILYLPVQIESALIGK